MAGKSGPPRSGRRQRPSPASPSGDSGGAQRLQKVLAAAGVASRRDCEELIREGRVEVDGQAVTEMGVKVDPALCEIRVDGTILRQAKLVYYAVNKPPGVVCTSRDPAGRPRVIDLTPQDERVFAVGRLDRASEGLILATNDGGFANRVTHPRYGVDKTYIVRVAGRPSPESLLQLRKGVWTSDGLCRVKSVHVKGNHGQSTDLIVVLAEGKNREIRRILARVGHKVLLLRRVAVGPVKLGKLESGAFRKLTPVEVAALLEEARQKRKREQHRSEARPPRAAETTTGAAGGSQKRRPRPDAADPAPAAPTEYREELRSGRPARGAAPRGDVIDFEAGDELPPAHTSPREIANLPLLDDEDELSLDETAGAASGGGFASGEIPAELLDDDFDFSEPLAGDDDEYGDDEYGDDESDEVFAAEEPGAESGPGGKRPPRGGAAVRGAGSGRGRRPAQGGRGGGGGARAKFSRGVGEAAAGGGGRGRSGGKPGGKAPGKKFRGGKASGGYQQGYGGAGGEREAAGAAGEGYGQGGGRPAGGKGKFRAGKFGKKPGGKRPFGKPGGGRGAGGAEGVQQSGQGRPAGRKPGGKPAGGKSGGKPGGGKFGAGKQRRGKRPGGGQGGGGRSGGRRG